MHMPWPPGQGEDDWRRPGRGASGGRVRGPGGERIADGASARSGARDDDIGEAPVTDASSPVPQGPLAMVLEVRRGPDDAHTGGLEHREAVIYALGKAAELEHLVMLQYLFAAVSLKQSVDEGLSPESLGAVQRWRNTLLEISHQEMLHLALVQNLLTAIGAAPRLARPN